MAQPVQPALTGSRIRQRRLDRGLSQVELAAVVGISASYLNLIEHNRRRIGGALLNAIARELGSDPALLVEGGGAGLAAALRAAAGARPEAGAELERAEDLAGRFPGWARLLAAQAGRIGALEEQMAALTDRLTHDPALAASMHEVISAVTAIRSTASILASGEALDGDWQARFHRNIFEDSQRLAAESRSLAAYLEGPGEAALQTPFDELEAALERAGQHLPALEAAGAEPEAILTALPGLSAAAAPLALAWARRYRADARALPLQGFAPLAKAEDHDPGALVAATGAPAEVVLRRLATLPPSGGHPAFGLAICDAAGALTRLRPLPGLALPRSGGCPLWPLFQALGQPGRPIAARVAMPGERGGTFLAHAAAAPERPAGFGGPAPLTSVMLLRPAPAEGAAIPAGTACRICPRTQCSARREPALVPGMAPGL
ncbi:helix-turn-helix domain-containing protein [Pseudoroseicyclus sp. CXY001]|uniref:helix-turn-helix domain-containing protein n=1 Tax=Pseudoroseicyclus sp. CXY001 TaxID=3242492 RepID=UPI003570AFA5